MTLSQRERDGLSLEQELKIYQEMYYWYSKSSIVLWFLELFGRAYTDRGFCRFLSRQVGSDGYLLNGGYFNDKLTTLMGARPTHTCNGYWYRRGAIGPRRLTLSICINNVKAQISIRDSNRQRMQEQQALINAEVSDARPE